MANKYLFRVMGFLLILLSQHDQYRFVVGKPSFGVMDLLLLAAGVSMVIGIKQIKRGINSVTPSLGSVPRRTPFVGGLLFLAALIFSGYPFWHFSNLPRILIPLLAVFAVLLWSERTLGGVWRFSVVFIVVSFFLWDFFYLSSLFAMFSTLIFLFLFIKKNGKKKIHIPEICIVAIFVVALLIRIPAINDKVPKVYPAHLDSILQINETFPYAPATARSNIGVWFEYPPLSYYIAVILYRINIISQSIPLFYFGKLLIVLLGSLSIFPLYFIFKKLTEKNIALFGALIFALVPLVKDYDQGRFSTAFGSFLFLATLYFVINAFVSKKINYFVYGGISNGFLLLAHPFPAVVLSVYLFFLILLKFPNFKRLDRLEISSLSKGFFFFLLISFLIGVVWWGPIFDRHGLKVLHPSMFRTDFNSAPDFCVAENNPWVYIPENLPTFPLLFILAFFGILRIRSRHPDELLALWGAFLFFALSFVVGISFITRGDRYLSYTAPLLYVLAGAGLLLLCEHFLNFRKKFGFILLMGIAFLLLTSTYSFHIALKTNPKKDIEDLNMRAMNWIAENTPKDSVVITDSWAAYRLPYFGKRGVLNGKEGSEFTNHKNLVDAASVFSLNNESEVVNIMTPYRAKYIYILNSSKKLFPMVGEDDCHGPTPAISFWQKANWTKFKTMPSFKPIYNETTSTSETLIYWCIGCGS